MTAEVLQTGVVPAAPSMRKLIVAATIGNVLEWFDFLVYGFFAVTIAEVFFPAGNPTVSLLVTFGAFGLSYLVRPLGAIIVGNYTDRHGRKAGLTLSIGLMMIGTVMMLVPPSFATIGLAAPVLITLARLLQGFSVGGEFGSAVAFLTEHGADRKGLSASWQWASTGIISVIVALFGVALTTLLTHDQLVDWGWRIPYVFGLLVGPAGLYIRYRMTETSKFLEAEKPQSIPIGDLLRRHPVPALLALGMSIISNSSYYLLLYIPTYGVKTLHLPAWTGVPGDAGRGRNPRDRLAAGRALGRQDRRLAHHAVDGMAVPAGRLSGILADGSVSLPGDGDVRGFLNLIKAGYSGILPSQLALQFPVETRAVGVAFSYSISVTVFGGFAPFVTTWLIAETGDPLSPSFYLMATALLSVIALMAVRRRENPT